MILAALVGIYALCSTAQEIERGATWYWPVGSPFGTRQVLQAYGQLETIPGIGSEESINEVHEGLDVAAKPGDPVYAPFAGQVVEVKEYTGSYSHYGKVVIAREGSGWLLTVTHLEGITVKKDKSVVAGEKLGYVVDWPELVGFDHVHLGLIESEPYTTSGDTEYITGALPFLGGHVDVLPPAFQEIEVDGSTLYPVAFVKDDPTCEAELEFYDDHANLPEGELDVLARIDDWLAPSATAEILVVIPMPWPIWSVTFTLSLPSTWTYPVTTPAHLSLRITSLSDEDVFFEYALDFTRSVKDVDNYAYRRSTSGIDHVTGGWPDGPFYFLLTNSHGANGSWDAKSGKYLVEVAVEDLAGNQDHQFLNIEVKSP